MRVGVVLPHFRHDAGTAIAMAEEAESLGLDGVFCYDHFWPMGQPGRPALTPFPLLGALAVRTRGIRLGTLVARIGTFPPEVLVAEFRRLAELAPGRVVAGLGTGDHKSLPEMLAYGLPETSAGERRRELRHCLVALRTEGVEVWVGGGSPATRRVAVEEGVALNVWGAPPDEVARRAREGEVTWGGPDPGGLPELLVELARAGATWAVLGPAPPLGELADAARAVR